MNIWIVEDKKPLSLMTGSPDWSKRQIENIRAKLKQDPKAKIFLALKAENGEPDLSRAIKVKDVLDYTWDELVARIGREFNR